jgi:hypothetical protein
MFVVITDAQSAGIGVSIQHTNCCELLHATVFDDSSENLCEKL